MTEAIDTTKVPEVCPNAKMTKDVNTQMESAGEIIQETTNTSLSPEVFIPDDNIVNTQESNMMENDLPTTEVVNAEDISTKEKQAEKMIHQEDKDQMLNERRWSERLTKDTTLTTVEKNERMAQQRNLEGNSKKPTSFSMLPTGDIIHISANMGVNINHDDFETFELIRDLEKARDDLYMKQCENNKTYQTETVEIVGNNSNLLELEWLNEESSEPEDFLLVESRKKKKGK